MSMGSDGVLKVPDNPIVPFIEGGMIFLIPYAHIYSSI